MFIACCSNSTLCLFQEHVIEIGGHGGQGINQQEHVIEIGGDGGQGINEQEHPIMSLMGSISVF